MNPNRFSLNIRFYAIFPLVFLWSSIHAQSDFSCVQQELIQKQQVNQSYLEFDIRISNQCKRPVSWSICVEKINPWTRQIVGTIDPSGTVNPGDSPRINLLMNRQRNPVGPEMEYEKFYFNMAYADSPGTTAACVATECEREKGPLMIQLNEVNADLQKALQQRDQQVEKSCRGGDVSDSSCEQKVTQIDKPYRDSLRSKVAEIQAQLDANTEPYCQLLPN